MRPMNQKLPVILFVNKIDHLMADLAEIILSSEPFIPLPIENVKKIPNINKSSEKL